MRFFDKENNELHIGDILFPDNGLELRIVSSAFVEEDVGEECMFGQQLNNPLAFSLLTQENLSKQWHLKK